MKMKTAIILAGGFGTRLKHVVSDVPKPMGPINGKPFLEYLLASLAPKGIKKVILATGYKHQVIADYFGNSYNDIEVTYSVENEPLGTGGAIAKAMRLVNESEKEVLVLNGDSFFDFDLASQLAFHQKNESDITIALKEMTDFDRYGLVKVTNTGEISAFEEKKPTTIGLINSGCYLLNTSLRSQLQDFGAPFSFEKAVLENDQLAIKRFGLQQTGYFIDIGIPEDYAKAAKYFNS